MSKFLIPGSNFPPKEFEFWFDKYTEWEVWYSGDRKYLLDYYVNSIGDETQQQLFWAKMERAERADILHLPAAGDIAQTSADLLFSESPEIKFKSNIVQDNVKEILDINGFENLILEGAELAAALSGCFLKIDIDETLLKFPIIEIRTPKQCLPTFNRGRLVEITFFREVKRTEDGKVWRLFESRKNLNKTLYIEYKVFRGTDFKLGIEVDINSLDETKNLNLSDIEFSNMSGLACVYVPNKRPNNLAPGSALGLNDYSRVISLMDSLDFTWTSLLNDIELGMSQIFIDEELLSKKDDGTSYFSKFKKAFTKLKMSTWKMGGENGIKPIETIQFNIRVDEHLKACEKLFYQIVTLCGYSPQTFGLGDFGNIASGAGLKILEHKSQKTRMKKSRYWIPALKDLIYQLQLLSLSAGLSSGFSAELPSIQIEDSIVPDSLETSNVLKNLETARAISTFEKVKLLNPDWTDDQVNEEVLRILKEQGITNDIFNNNNESEVNKNE